MKKLNIISPIYNEEKNLENLIDKLLLIEKKIQNQFNLQTSIILVNDGSNDESYNIIEKYEKKFNQIKGLHLTKNFGHQTAIFAGLSEFKADYYIAIDSDLQQDPENIILMLQTLFSTNCQIIQMKKKYFNYENKIKSLFSKFFYSIFLKLTNIDIKQGSSDFYLIDNVVRDSIVKSKFSGHFLRGFIHWTGYSKAFIEYTPQKRSEGKSKYNFLRQLEFALTGLYFYSSKIPVYIFLLALSIGFLCLIYFIFILTEFFIYGIPTPGWASNTIIILFFGAINILFNSIMIFLIFKIFNTVGNKPTYLKKEKETKDTHANKNN